MNTSDDRSASVAADDQAARNSFYNLGAIIIADRVGDATALVELGIKESPRIYSRVELERQCNALARGLAGRGLGRGDRIAILAENRAEYLIAVLGALRAGLVAVPVNFKLPPATVEFILRDSDSQLVLCDAGREHLCPDDLPCVVFDSSSASGFGNLLDPGNFTAVHPVDDDPALFLYTSGSTGRPKGVVLTHGGHLWALRARPRQVEPGQRVLVAAPLYHMNGLMTSLASLSQTASTIVLLPSFTARQYIHAIEQYQCNVLTAVPTMIALMLRESEVLNGADTTSVKFIRSGSAPTTQALIDATRAVFPAADIVNAYGTTEGGPVVFAGHPLKKKRPELSVGFPHPEVEVRLVDSTGEEADNGVLQLKCPALMKCYHKMPVETERVFTENGFYITGDRFERDNEGFLYFVGRTDDMFDCGGENIYPGEIEKVLETHPDIHQACVVPVADDIKGHKPVAFVVCKPDRMPTEKDMKEYSINNLAAYQHPRHVWFLPRLPLAGTNKIDRTELIRRAASMVTGADADKIRDLHERKPK